MPLVKIYGDTHNDEEVAEAIHKSVLSQSPDAVFMEMDLNGAELRYLEKALGNYDTLREIYSAYQKDLNGSDSDVLDKPLYLVEGEKLKNILKGIFNGSPSQSQLKRLTNPKENLIGEKKDLATYALFHQISVRTVDDRSTLASRIIPECKKRNIRFFRIDINRDKMFIHGAKKIDKLPDNPKKVKRIYQKMRKGKMSKMLLPQQKERYAEGVKELINEFQSERESLMAAQVEDNIERQKLQDSAVIVGNNHMKPIARFLGNNRNYSVETYNPKSSGIIKSIKNIF